MNYLNLIILSLFFLGFISISMFFTWQESEVKLKAVQEKLTEVERTVDGLGLTIEEKEKEIYLLKRCLYLSPASPLFFSVFMKFTLF